MTNGDIVDIKGDILTLDPKSKLIITAMMIIGVSVSIEPFQVLVFGILTLPLIYIYKPNIRFLKKILISSPWLISLLIVLSISIKEPVTIHLFNFTRTYSPFNFALLVSFRFSVSALHTTILIDSEPNVINIIEALSSFKINENLVTILLLIHRISTTIKSDYNTKILAAKTRGALRGKGLAQFSFKIQIMGRILAQTLSYSDNTADILTARGFDGEFTSTIRSWTSDGLTVMLIMAVFWTITLFSPLLRVYY